MIQDELPKAAQRKLDALRRAVDRYCRIVQKSNRYSDVELLRRLNAALIDVLSKGHALPVLDPWADEPEYDDEVTPIEEPAPFVWRHDPDDPGLKAHLADFKDAHALLEARLEGRDYHRLVVDPYSPDSRQRDVVTASLSDQLASLYADFMESRREDKTGGPDSEPPFLRMWHWRFQIHDIWGGYKLLPTLWALSFLIYNYWDEDEGWLETWQPEPHSCPLPDQDA